MSAYTQPALAPHQGIGISGSPRTPSYSYAYSWDGPSRSAAASPMGSGILDRGNMSPGVKYKIAHSEQAKGGDEAVRGEIGAESEGVGVAETETELDSEPGGDVTSQGSLTSVD